MVSAGGIGEPACVRLVNVTALRGEPETTEDGA
jgi:hypothetical protein